MLFVLYNNVKIGNDFITINVSDQVISIIEAVLVMDIKIGDIVMHKNGGPAMTIDYIIGHTLTETCEVIYAPGIERGSAICVWKNSDGKTEGKVFNPEDLVLVKG